MRAWDEDVRDSLDAGDSVGYHALLHLSQGQVCTLAKSLDTPARHNDIVSRNHETKSELFHMTPMGFRRNVSLTEVQIIKYKTSVYKFAVLDILMILQKNECSICWMALITDLHNHSCLDAYQTSYLINKSYFYDWMDLGWMEKMVQ